MRRRVPDSDGRAGFRWYRLRTDGPVSDGRAGFRRYRVWTGGSSVEKVLLSTNWISSFLGKMRILPSLLGFVFSPLFCSTGTVQLHKEAFQQRSLRC
ncbi:hypothetical protein CapIbe_008662 [Capra ibex]